MWPGRFWLRRCRCDVHGGPGAPRERLDDILSAVGRIAVAEGHLVSAEAAGDHPGVEVAYDAVMYNLVVIGEAVNALPADRTNTEPEVPWRDIVDMRNFLTHKYFRVLSDVVRNTIDEPLRQLEEACRRMAEREPEQ